MSDYDGISQGLRSGVAHPRLVYAWEGQVAELQAKIDRLTAALTQSVTAIDDWLNIYAAEHCDAQRVKEAEKRVYEYGTLSYITTVQERNRAALGHR